MQECKSDAVRLHHPTDVLSGASQVCKFILCCSGGKDCLLSIEVGSFPARITLREGDPPKSAGLTVFFAKLGCSRVLIHRDLSN